MPPVASRRGRRIASKACDSCRVRKVQCIFERGDNTACKRCEDGGVDCTFLSDRKQRGPAARRTPTNLSIPIGDVSIEHLCPQSAFSIIIDDFLYLVYPVLPLIHRPSFRASIDNANHTRDPSFFRLCLAICAVTIASIPRKFSEYSRGKYTNIGAMVDRACHIVLLSRIATEPEWQNHPSIDTVIVSLLLATATHYVGHTNQGWGYVSEATQSFRALELYSKGGYVGLTVVQGEMCKRVFWLLYIAQIHDRLSFTVPHTGLSFDPVMTDWEFLLPAEIEDEEMLDTVLATEFECKRGIGSTSLSFGVLNPPPVISGFVALVRVFLCAVDLLSSGFPGSAPAFALTSGPLGKQIHSGHNHNQHHQIDTSSSNTSTLPDTSPRKPSTKSPITLTDVLHIIHNLQTTVQDLPPVLKIPTTCTNQDLQLQTSTHFGPAATTQTYNMSETLTNQFNVMRANIHITSLYIQSSILEACSSAFYTVPQQHTDCAFPISPATDDTLRSGMGNGSGIGSPAAGAGGVPNWNCTPRMQLWGFRKRIAEELLEVLRCCDEKVLEANGHSMIIKIREIAATLLDNDFDASPSSSSAAASASVMSAAEHHHHHHHHHHHQQQLNEQNRLYVAEFAEILAQLDHLGGIIVISPK